MHSRFEQARIGQLLGDYAPGTTPQFALDFSDYLSLLWRFDGCAALPARARYYRACIEALGQALGIEATPMGRMVAAAAPGTVYDQLPNLPYRSRARLLDARDRKAAAAQLIDLRRDILRIGTYQESWNGSFPGHGLLDIELRERVFAVLFTALQGQYGSFARLLLVVDIVLGDLLIGPNNAREIPVYDLVTTHGYPDPASRVTRREFAADELP
jgi:hypothetical protein